MRPCVDRANQEPPSLPGSRSRPSLQEHVYFAYYIRAVHVLKNNLCLFRSQCMGLSESMLFYHTLTDCFKIKTFSNTLLFTFYVLIKLLHDAICSVLSEFAVGFLQVIVHYITSNALSDQIQYFKAYISCCTPANCTFNRYNDIIVLCCLIS